MNTETMLETKLFSPYTVGNIEIKNRIVMAPMRRSRAVHNVPGELMATYYAQRAGAGLIISEPVSPSPNGLGYAGVPGIFTEEQVNGWRRVSEAVHAAGGHIFMQLTHAGRIGHPLNIPPGATLVAPSVIKPHIKIGTDSQGEQSIPPPMELTREALAGVQLEYVKAAQNAIRAGFDGIEVQAGSGYLPEQFLSPFSNRRNDEYNGSIKNRSRFVLEITEAVSNAIGRERTGIQLSPYSIHNDMAFYLETDETYTYLAEELNQLDIAYIHLADYSGPAPSAPLYLKQDIGRLFQNCIILGGDYNGEKAERDLRNGIGDLIAFGTPFVSHPDLAARLENNWPLSNPLDPSTFYGSGEKGYTDYPAYAGEAVIA